MPKMFESYYFKDLGIHQLFEAQVERSPNAIAVVFKDKQFTYRELNCRANQLAHYLQTLGVGTEVLVGICLDRSLTVYKPLFAQIRWLFSIKAASWNRETIKNYLNNAATSGNITGCYKSQSSGLKPSEFCCWNPIRSYIVTAI